MADQETPPKRFPGPDPLGEIASADESSLLSSEFVDVYRQLFEADQTNTVQPYMALASAFFGYSENNDTRSSTDTVDVPVWAAQAITHGFMIYRNAVLDGQEMRFGVAMGLEGQGKGSKPRLVKETRRIRDWKLALAVALHIDAGEKPTSAVHKVANEFMVSSSTAWRIWGKNQNFVTKCLTNFRTLTT